MAKQPPVGFLFTVYNLSGSGPLQPLNWALISRATEQKYVLNATPLKQIALIGFTRFLYHLHLLLIKGGP